MKIGKPEVTAQRYIYQAVDTATMVADSQLEPDPTMEFGVAHIVHLMQFGELQPLKEQKLLHVNSVCPRSADINLLKFMKELFGKSKLD